MIKYSDDSSEIVMVKIPLIWQKWKKKPFLDIGPDNPLIANN